MNTVCVDFGRYIEVNRLVIRFLIVMVVVEGFQCEVI